MTAALCLRTSMLSAPRDHLFTFLGGDPPCPLRVLSLAAVATAAAAAQVRPVVGAGLERRAPVEVVHVNGHCAAQLAVRVLADLASRTRFHFHP
jgi:hypothetical protein